ncbi:TonB-dependent receptor [Aestuariibacter sp. AA17]|uniref:TonB-dependent receptor n=1 Tax=Fluctibacter corallii TaxID=2984329 RepID=A0ABT3ACK4_9ALTE|nr:TonB-dependent receptor [Aestuariibacter sp. AA17]MCV2886355.1 TonB-dependent receptor [Aestuariibacter sp. AA17]
MSKYRRAFSFLSCVPFSMLANESIETIYVVGQSHRDSAHIHLNQALDKQGVGFSAAGGLAPLPIINGLMGDRIGVVVDGATVASACGNHMNPPLSYVSANQVTSINVSPMVSPVSEGGDNIAGVIQLETLSPRFSDSQHLAHLQTELGAEYQSNGDAHAINAGVQAANKAWFVGYAGSYARSNSYDDGDGNRVLDTLYEGQNHTVNVAYQDAKQQLSVKLHHQMIPYQGFANQYMDMTDNRSTKLGVQYQRFFQQFELDGRVSWQATDHEMGFFTEEKQGRMVMLTEGDDMTATLDWTFPLTDNEQIKVGQLYVRQQLDDWWPAVTNSMMMGPNDYINVNNGQRSRKGIYAEYSQAPQVGWYSLLGVRYEKVKTDTSNVQPYNSMPMDMMPNADAQAAIAFNLADKRQTDDLVDVTAHLHYQFDSTAVLTFGVAQKNRAPNLYERYSWGRGPMATSMIGWYGDGNGYVGRIQLKPEQARTLSVEYQVAESAWQFGTQVWHTHVDDYIDAQVIGSFNRTSTPENARNILQFTNVDAQLYGAKLTASYTIPMKGEKTLTLRNNLQWQHGRRAHSNLSDSQKESRDLYQIIPIQNTVSVTYAGDDMNATLEWEWVDAKRNVDTRRRENQTRAYHLLNLQLQSQWKGVTYGLAIDNLLDHDYQLPLGGVNIAQFANDPEGGYEQVKGAGRSLKFQVNWRFE